MDDGALEVGVGADPDVGAEHRVLAEAGAGLDPAVVADDGRARRSRRRGATSAPSPSHTPVAELEAGDRRPATLPSRTSLWART